MVSQDIIEKIRESSDIVSVVEEYFPLSRAGANYKALCPFHQEKTPSFTVSPDKQIYHCFGCGESGNVFNFIMKMDNLDFIDVLKRLSDRTGIKLDFEKNKEYQKRQKLSDMILEANKAAADFYAKCLKSEKAKKAFNYLVDRGVSEEMVERFKLGYAPGGNQFSAYALKKGIKESVLLKAGLSGRDDYGKLYDRFRNRVMYPILDEMGRFVGFGGRIIDDSQGPKYLNTAQTEVFEKRKLMYGFYQGKEKIKKAKKLLLLEGYMDVIAAHQFGIPQAVATLGTALSVEHIYKLKHWVDEVVFSFDADEAGKKAAVRGLDIVLGSEMRAKVCERPEGNDPEDIIRKNKEEFIKYLKKAKPVLNWRLDYSIEKFTDIEDSADRKVRIVRDLAPVINRVSPIKKAELVKTLSARLNISESAINQEISRIKSDQPSYIKEKTQNSSGNDLLSKEEKLCKEILHVIIRFPKYLNELNGILSEDDNSGRYYHLLSDYVKIYNGDIHNMIENVDEKVRNILTALSVKSLNSSDKPGEHLSELKKEYKKVRMIKRLEEVSKEINLLIKTNMPVDKEKKKEYNKLIKALKGVRRNNKIGGYFA
jgi:DNA primase